MRSDAQITKAIMRRVYFIYGVRWLMQTKVRIIAFLGILLGIASSVSMPNVFANALRSSDLVGFSIAAVSHTTFYIQLGVLFAALIVVASVIEALRPRSDVKIFA
jgi:hypothetical protein